MTTVPQLREAMRAIEEQKGELSLFGLFMRADSPGSWDLVVAAPWLEVGKLKALGELLRLLEQHLGEREVRRFAKVITLKASSPDIRAELDALNIQGAERRFFNTTLFGADIQEAVILRAKSSDVRSETQSKRLRASDRVGRQTTRKRIVRTARD